jgi:hypothetical protein
MHEHPQVTPIEEVVLHVGAQGRGSRKPRRTSRNRALKRQVLLVKCHVVRQARGLSEPPRTHRASVRAFLLGEVGHLMPNQDAALAKALATRLAAEGPTALVLRNVGRHRRLGRAFVPACTRRDLLALVHLHAVYKQRRATAAHHVAPRDTAAELLPFAGHDRGGSRLLHCALDRILHRGWDRKLRGPRDARPRRCLYFGFGVSFTARCPAPAPSTPTNTIPRQRCRWVLNHPATGSRR